MFRSLNKLCSHCGSQVREAKDLYSASVDDRETIGCFFNFQQINEEPRRTQKLVIDFLLSGHLAQ